MRLPKHRRGTTAIDVNMIKQNGTVRVRITMGEHDSKSHKNADLTPEEADDLATMLAYHAKLVRDAV